MRKGTRKPRRATAIKLTMALLETEKEGMRVGDIVSILRKAMRSRVSENSLGQFMRSKVNSGEVEKSTTSEGHSFWKLNQGYIPSKETV